MSFWETVTFTIDYEDDVESKQIDKLQEKVLNYIEKKGGKAHSYVTKGQDLLVYPHKIYPDEEMLEDLADYFSRAVVIQANNTGDIGEAYLYKVYEREFSKERKVEQVDVFREREQGNTGRRAAAYMLFEHGINAQASYDNKWEHTEKKIGFEGDN